MAPTDDRSTLPFPGVSNQRICPGCKQPFTPKRSTQQHCSARCRLRACRARRAVDIGTGDEALAAGAAAGHVEPEVMGS